MKISMGKPDKVLFDDHGNSYVTKEFITSGRRVTSQGKLWGWELWLGNFLLRIKK